MSATTSPDVACARIAQRLADSVGPRRYQMWFDRSARFGYDDRERRLKVAVPNRFIADWIGRNFDDQLRRVAAAELGEDVELSVQVEPEQFPSEQAESPRPADVPVSAPRRRPTMTPVAGNPLRYRLEQFVVGPSNQMAFSAANALVDDAAIHTGPLFIHGGCGLGKTHLLQGLCARMLQQRPDAAVHYTTGEQFTNEFLTAVRTNRIDAFRRRIRKLDLLAVDDVHFIADKQATQQEFLHSFDAIELGGARVVMASDCHPKLIRKFSEALVSRCVRGFVVEVHKPDTTTRMRIIRSLAQRRGITLLEPAVSLLANRCNGSVRDIEGMLTRLHALAHLDGSGRRSTGVGRALVDRLFEVATASMPRKPIRFDAILETVAEHLHVERAAILGTNRNRNVVLARSMVIHLARLMTSMSYPEIAAAMGRNNHSTIITAAKRIREQIADSNAQCTLPGTMEPITLADLADQLFHRVHSV